MTIHIPRGCRLNLLTQRELTEAAGRTPQAIRKLRDQGTIRPIGSLPNGSLLYPSTELLSLK